MDKPIIQTNCNISRRVLSDDDYLLLYGHPINSIRHSISTIRNQTQMSSNSFKRHSYYELIKNSKTLKNFEKEYEQELNRRKHSKYTLKQNSYPLWIYNIIKGYLIIYSVTSTLFYLAFSQSHEELSSDRAVWTFFMFDFFLQLIIEKRDKKDRKVQNFKMIFEIYLKSWMIPDILTLIPYSWFKNPNVEFSFRLIRVFKLNFLFKLINVKVLTKIVAKFFSAGQSNKQKKMVFALLHIWDLFSEISILIFITYFLACIWLYYTDFIARKFDPSQQFHDVFTENDSKITQMIKVWYFLFSTLCTSGFGDFYSVNRYEMAMNTLIIIIGPTWYAYTNSKVFKILDSLYNLTKNSNKQGELAIWISSTESKHSRMKLKLKMKINNFYLYYWKNDRLGNMGNSVTETSTLSEITQVQHNLLQALPLTVQHQIFDFLFGDVFKKFSYFFGRDSLWKYHFSLYLQPRVYLKGKKIIKLRQEVHEVLFVTDGKFDIKAKKNKKFVQVKIIKGNWIVGDYFVLKDIKPFFIYSVLNVVYGFAVPAFVFKSLVKLADLNFCQYFKGLENMFDELIQQVADDEFETTRWDMIHSLRNGESKFSLSEECEEEFDVVGLEKIAGNMKRVRNGDLVNVKEQLIRLMFRRFKVE